MSREAPNFAYLLAALLVIAVLGQTFVSHLSGFLIGLLSNVGSIHLESGGDVMLLFNVVGKAAGSRHRADHTGLRRGRRHRLRRAEPARFPFSSA